MLRDTIIDRWVKELDGEIYDLLEFREELAGERLVIEGESDMGKMEKGLIGEQTKGSAAEVFGVTLKCDAHELKHELGEAIERVNLLIAKFKELKQLADPLYTEMFRNLISDRQYEREAPQS